MTFRGHIKDGKVVLDHPLELPDGTPVKVQAARRNGKAGRPKPSKSGKRPAKRVKRAPTLAERLKGFIGSARGLPRDGAGNHDRYLYGGSKR